MNIKHNIKEYETFRIVYENGSVTAAAKQLAISQPAASQFISSLEEKSQFLLFRRAKGQLYATQKATELYKALKPFFSGLNFINSNIWTEQAKTTLHIMAQPSFASPYFVRLVTSFIKKNPLAKISFAATTDRVAQKSLVEGRAHIAVRFANTVFEPDLAHIPFVKSRSVCLLPRDHRLARHLVVTPELLSGEPQIAQTGRHLSRTIVERVFVEAGAKFNVNVELSANHLISEMIRLRKGVGIVNSFPVTQSLSDEIVVKHFEPSITRYSLFTHSSRHSLPPIAHDLIGFLRENVIQSSHTELVSDKFEMHEDHLDY